MLPLYLPNLPPLYLPFLEQPCIMSYFETHPIQTWLPMVVLHSSPKLVGSYPPLTISTSCTGQQIILADGYRWHRFFFEHP